MARWARPLLVLAGLGFIAYLIHQVGPATVWTSVSALGWRLLIVLCFPFSAAAALDTLAWRVLLRDAGAPFGMLLRARLAGEAVNLATPTASVGGEPLKAYLLRPRVPLAEGLASVVVDKTAVVAGQGLYLLVGLAAGASLLPLSSPLMIAMASILAVEVVALGGFVLVQTQGVFGGGARLLGRLGMGLAGQYQDGLADLDRRLARAYRERRGRILGAMVLHALAWATGGLEIYLVLTLLGIPASLVTALVIESFGAAVKFASFMIPASLGALEGGYLAIFAGFGLSGAVGLSYTLVRRLREAAWVAAGFLLLATRPSASRPVGRDGC